MQPQMITDHGKKLLGELLIKCRKQQGWSQEDLVVELRVRTGHRIGKSQISYLENGVSAPGWDTLAKLAAVGYITTDSGQPLDTHALFDVACERLNPFDSQHLGGQIERKYQSRQTRRLAAEDDQSYPSNQVRLMAV